MTNSVNLVLYPLLSRLVQDRGDEGDGAELVRVQGGGARQGLREREPAFSFGFRRYDM